MNNIKYRWKFPSKYGVTLMRERECVNERESINGIILAAHSGINFHKNNSEY